MNKIFKSLAAIFLAAALMFTPIGDFVGITKTAEAATQYYLFWPISVAMSASNIPSGGTYGAYRTAQRNHSGLDISATAGNKIYAVADGEVMFVGSTDSRGNYVVIYHPSLNISSLYQHLASYSVSSGQKVTVGQQIALSGNTGTAGTYHLHLGLMYGKATSVNYDLWYVGSSTNSFDPSPFTNSNVHYSTNINDLRRSEVGHYFYGYIFRPDSGQYLTYHDDGNVTADAFTGAENQTWWFDYDSGDSSAHPIMTYNGKHLRIEGTASGSNVCVGDWDSSYYIYGSSGGYTIVPNAATGMALDISTGSTEFGTNVQIFYKNDTEAQTWDITPLTTMDKGYQAESLYGSIPTRNLYYSSGSSIMKGDDVKWLQKCLNKLGFSCDIDSSYGPATASAVSSFQSAYGLSADGKAGEITRTKIIELLKPLGNTISVSTQRAEFGSIVTAKAVSTGSRYINNYNFHVIEPNGTDRYYQLGADNTLNYRVVQTGTYKFYCTMNNDAGQYYDTNNYVSVVVPESISSAVISAIPAQTYTGSAITPAVTVTKGGTTLVKGTDYSVTYSANVNAGTATVTVTGINGYTGTKTATFTIALCPIGNAALTAVAAQIYTGSAIQPAVTLAYNSKTLVKGTDYNVSYSGNVNAGNATISISGVGNFTGTKTGEFTINPRSINDVTIAAIPSFTYSGEEIKPDITASYNGKTLIANTDYTLSYSNNINPGTATVTVSGKGNFSGTRQVTFTIEKAPVEAPKITSVIEDNGKVTVVWSAVNGAEMYRVYIVDGTTYTRVYSGDAPVTQAVISGLTNGTEYAFAATAKADGEWSDYSSIVYATPHVTKPTITGYKVGDYQVKLEWTALEGAEMYRVYTYTDGVYTRQFTCDGNRNIATVTGLEGGTEYGFVVSAKVNGAWTDYSDKADLLYATPTGITKPSIVGYKVGNYKVKLEWKAVDGAEMYRVYTYENGVYTRKFTCAGARNIATVTGLVSGTNYGFVVSAKVDGVWTDYSNAADLVYATPTGDPAPVITGYTTGDGKVKLAWYALEGAEMYRVYSLLDGVYTRQFTTYTSTTATVTGLVNGTEYGFVVSAKVDGVWTDYNVPELILYATPNA